MSNIVIPDGGTIGSASDTDAIAISSGGNVTLSQTLDGGAIGSAVTMSANQACVKTALNASGNPGIFACRAFVNFDGNNAFSPNPSTSAIRSSGNVTSITETAAGRFQINITTAFPDGNYSVVGMTGGEPGASQNVGVSIEDVNVSLPTTTMIPIVIRRRNDSVNVDSEFVSIACFA